MANGGISVKQAIENELEGKDEYSIKDTVTCIKHIAQGLDNLPCSSQGDRLTILESQAKWYRKAFGTLWGVTGGALVLAVNYFLGKK